MKISINKNAKRFLSLVLAFAVLVGTLFVANVGVTFNADATAEKITVTWSGSYNASLDSMSGTGTSDDPYIIETAEQLAFVARGATTTGWDKNPDANPTFNKHFKVADNIEAFDMKNMAYGSMWLNGSTTTDHDNNGSNDGRAFMGTFDGNGVVVYNITASSHGAGLFPAVEGGATIKNVTVKDSSFTSSSGNGGAGAIIGDNRGGNATVVTVENCHVENCEIIKSATDSKVGAIIGYSHWRAAVVKNCSAINNTITKNGAACQTQGLVGFAESSGSNVTISNSFAIGSAIDSLSSAKYASVYSDTTGLGNSNVIIKTSSEMQGANVINTMPGLDYVNTWFANTSGAPVHRAFHNVSAVNNGTTHSEKCADCDLVGVTAKHIYNVVDYTTNTTSCICGAWEWGTNDVWDGTKASSFAGGTGTEADPYIIKTVEQLFLMVRSTGVNNDGTPIYYEVADTVNALYINDTRAFADQAAFEAAASSLKNWSTGLTTEAECCGDTANCYSTHYNDVYTSSSAKVQNLHRTGYVDYFGGRFNGNGVTIYGLYSQTSAPNNHWNNGAGFVPMLTGDAVIKNVTFDTNYVKADTSSAAVITASVGIWDNQYNKDTDGNGSYETHAMCPKVDAYAKRPENSNAAIINVAVCNSYLEATNYVNNSVIAGFVSTIRTPNSLKIDNCFFDGTNSKFVDTATGTKKHCAFVSCNEANTNSTVTGCVSVAGNIDLVGYTSRDSYEEEATDKNGNKTGEIYTVYTHFNCHMLDSNEFTIEDAPLLNWLYWDVVDGKVTLKNNDSWIADTYNNQGKYNLSWRKNKVLTSTDVYGKEFEYSAIRGNRGVFNDYNTLIGSGTEADPYIISDADTLYLIIASGGTHYGVPQYFKLGCNIDLEGKQWIDTDIFENIEYDVVFYDYQPFAGTLDGDGYTIYNLYSATENYAGFIPRLEGGTVKNLHFRNAYVASSESTAGVITGWMQGEGTFVTGCSVENAAVFSEGGFGDSEVYIVYNDDPTTMDEYGIVSDCYYIGKDKDGNDTARFIIDHNDETGIVSTDAYNIKSQILAGNTEYISKWYLGGKEDAIPHLIENAKAQPCADIDGDGVGEEYTASDVSALKNNLLWEDGYDYIYGDVTGDGNIDMRDLATLQRIMTKQDTTAYDGFLANVKAGKFTIYYDETDNYDFARNLELYLERLTGVDIYKTKGSSSGGFAINIKTEGDADKYSISYDITDEENALLVIKGGSFTAVEEAVDAVIDQINKNGKPDKTSSGKISTEKNAIKVDGKDYYYAWGDEFNSDVAGTVNYDNWVLRNKGTDSTPGTPDTEFEYMRPATDAEAKEINVVKDGKLTLKRGFTGATATNEHKFFMSGISSKDSMLFKQGYMEMVATVPSDGYSFPAWWLLTHENGVGNTTIDKSLYSKVYERNPAYNGTSTSATPTDVTTYKYKLPTQTLEMDLFEIIQRPTETMEWSWDNWHYTTVSKPCDDHNIKFNIHKWYTYSRYKTDTELAIYDLDWANAPKTGPFPTKLLTANGATKGSGYNQQTATIKINTNNLKSDGGVNGAATYQGSVKTMEYDMENLRSNGQITARKYSFLWTEDKMTFTVYDDAAGTSVLYTATVNKNDMNFGGSESYSNSDTFGFDQYAYMLIENHIFTAQKNNSEWIQAAYDDIKPCDLVIDYVRLYQLDGARAIITPESEALSTR